MQKELKLKCLQFFAHIDMKKYGRYCQQKFTKISFFQDADDFKEHTRHSVIAGDSGESNNLQHSSL